MNELGRQEIQGLESELNLRGKRSSTVEEDEKFAKMQADGDSLPPSVKNQREGAKDGPYLISYSCEDYEFTPEERQYYVSLKQLEMLKSIKFWVKFCPILLIIGVVIAVFIWLVSMRF